MALDTELPWSVVVSLARPPSPLVIPLSRCSTLHSTPESREHMNTCYCSHPWPLIRHSTPPLVSLSPWQKHFCPPCLLSFSLHSQDGLEQHRIVFELATASPLAATPSRAVTSGTSTIPQILTGDVEEHGHLGAIQVTASPRLAHVGCR